MNKFKALHQEMKERAHGLVSEAVNKGILCRPDTCEICGLEKDQIHGHHADYSKPLEVQWLCRSCHMRIHSDQRPKVATIVKLDRKTIRAIKLVTVERDITRDEFAEEAVLQYLSFLGSSMGSADQ